MSQILLAKHRASLSSWRLLTKGALSMWTRFEEDAHREAGLLEQEGREAQAVCDKQREAVHAQDMLRQWEAFGKQLTHYELLIDKEDFSEMEEFNNHLHSTRPNP